MGLSASQARLLSITQRLNHNELQSEVLSMQKMRLADRNTVACRNYVEALDATKLDYISYNETGVQEAVGFSFNAMNYYTPLKNQYALRNSKGQIFVSELDKENFEKESTKTLYDFLKCYGLVTGEKRTEEVVTPNPAYAEWEIEHQEWEDSMPRREDYTEEKVTGTRRINTSPIYPALTTTIATCFNISVGSQKNCFMHVLSALIGVGEHTTSNGNTFNVHYTDDTDAAGNEYGWNWNTYSTSEEIGDAIRASIYHDSLSSEAYDGDVVTDYGTVRCTGTGADAATYGDNLYQKIVDFLWEVHGEYDGSSTGGLARADYLARFFYLIEFDLGDSYTEENREEIFNEEEYEEAMEEWRRKEKEAPPQELVTEKEINTLEINDKDKAQWYTNLFYRMNGLDITEQIKAEYDDSAETDAERTHYWTTDMPKTDVNGVNHYVVLDNILASDANWMQYMLNDGLATLEQAALRMDGNIKWQGIEYTSTGDIREVQDQTRIARAEVEYNQAILQIQAEDKQLDLKIKKLDTEHSACLKELDSIKKVMDKNIEKSFSAFS